MIYDTKARAVEVATELNARRGYPKAHAVRTIFGWTVVACFGTPRSAGYSEITGDSIRVLEVA